MTNKILFKINLIDPSTCLFCKSEERFIMLFLSAKMEADCEGSIECWIRRVIDIHFKFSDVDKIFGNLPMNITTNTTILAAH